MNPRSAPSSDIAFTPTVKAIQSRKGSRTTYARMEQRGGWRTMIDHDLTAFIEGVRSFFLATANSEGQPYVQHRGGPPGFLRVIDRYTLGFADFRGNRQFITEGNLEDNPKAFIFLIDYALQRRIKIWGKARMTEATPQLLSRLMPENYRAQPEQILLFDVEAWDVNCPQHIPQLFEAEDIARVLARRDARIAELEALLAAKGKT